MSDPNHKRQQQASNPDY